MREITLEALLKEGKRYLRKYDVPQSPLDAELLLMQVLDITRVEIYTKSKESISYERQIEYQELLRKRAQGIPLQYLKGNQEFMGLSFSVTPDVLIPRPDTEVLVESVQEYTRKENFQYLAEIGTGSGCISISLCYYQPWIYIMAGDISPDALRVAEQNGIRHHVQNQIEWIRSDVFQGFPDSMIGKFDAIVSNPPYIPTKDISTLMREVKDHEPYQALNGGQDGLDFYQRIIQEGYKFLTPNGYFFFEVGKDQAFPVSELLEKQGCDRVEIRKDLSGIERVVIGRKY